MLRKRSERASLGAWATSGMFLSDEYDGGALVVGGCHVPKSRGAGEADLDCAEYVDRSFMRLVLRTDRKRSVISAASLSTSLAGAREDTRGCSILDEYVVVVKESRRRRAWSVDGVGK